MSEAIAKPRGVSAPARFSVAMFYLILLPLLVLVLLAGVGIGSTSIPWSTILRVIEVKLLPAAWTSSHPVSQVDQVIVWIIRVPRVVVGFFVGVGLAAAGVVMQGLFRNPLAEPGIVGAGAGAVVGGVLAFVLGWSSTTVMMLPALSMLGALLALTLVYAMSTRGGVTPVATLLLAGVAVTALLTAVSSFLISLKIVNWQVAQDIVLWMMGGLDARSWTHVWICAPFVIVGTIAAFIQTRELDLLQLGEETAASFGVNVESSKRMLTLTAAILTGAAVAVSGMIAFVGLLIPHAVRLILGPANRRLLVGSSVAGGAFLVFCDILARTLRPPSEIRLGIITSLFGGPLFIFLLLRQYRGVGRES